MRKVMNIVIGVSAIVFIIDIVCIVTLISSISTRRDLMCLKIMLVINTFLFGFLMLARAWGVV